MTTIPREAEIRAAILAHPGLADRQIAQLLDIRLWSKVRRVREAMADAAAAATAPAPVQLLAPDVPAAGDTAPRQAVIAANPTVLCANCGREGTPAPARPAWCKACAAGGAEYRASWPRPEISPAAQISLSLLASFADNPAAADLLRRRYLRHRAADFGILETP